MDTKINGQETQKEKKKMETQNEEFLRLLFLHANREASALAGELSEESAQFRFIRAALLG